MPPKSGFSRARNVDYDDDGYDDDYYEEEYEVQEEGADAKPDYADMTADDKQQMGEGTMRVREALGEFQKDISDKTIQDALWHYYYDVAKSVSYLKNKFGATTTPKETPKKEKPVSKFDQVASIAAQKAPTTPGKFTHL